MTSREVRLTLPYTEPPEALRGNFRGHWSARSAASKEARQNVLVVGQSLGLHRLPVKPAHVTVCLTWAPGDHRRRDPNNLAPFAKALADGFTPPRVIQRRVGGELRFTQYVGLGLVPDDEPRWMTQEASRIVPPPARGMWLDLTLDFGEEVAA